MPKSSSKIIMKDKKLLSLLYNGALGGDFQGKKGARGAGESERSHTRFLQQKIRIVAATFGAKPGKGCH